MVSWRQDGGGKGGDSEKMRFTFHGLLDGKPVTVTWEDGRLEGDFAAVLKVRGLAARLEGSPVGPPGMPKTWHDHLRHPASTSEIVLRALDQLLWTEGDRVEPIPLPEGAIP